jgi:hypothetical protein
MEFTHLNCECFSPEHTLRLVADQQDLWLEIRLNYYPTGIVGFITRLKYAVLYLFGASPKAGHFDTFLFSTKDAVLFRDGLNDFIKSRSEKPAGTQHEVNNDIFV